MTVWRRCVYDSLYYDDKRKTEVGLPCEVRIEGELIEVCYVDDEMPVKYSGKEIARGHFDLSAPVVNGRSTLHMFPNSKVLEGYWVENGYRGMWRIQLAD